MAEDSGQEKTEKPTGKRLGKAKDEGQVAKSREVSSTALIGGALLAFTLFGSQWMQVWIESFQQGLDLYSVWQEGKWMDDLFGHWIGEIAKLVLPFFILFCILVIAANVSQIGFIFVTKPLTPKLDKLNPIAGLKRLISLNGLTELVKSILKIVVVAYLAYSTIKPEIHHLVAFFNLPLPKALSFSAFLAFKLVAKVWVAMVLLAVLDVFYQRWNHERGLRMTKQEVKEEHRETEGDPKVKSRIRKIQMEVSRKRMMQEVPNADVVITNPDHFAVAIRYDREQDMAPILLAKGAGLLCAQIKAVAKEHYIPIVRNPPLARFIYWKVALDQEVPVEIYQAIAEILAYVYRLKGKATDGVSNQ